MVISKITVYIKVGTASIQEYTGNACQDITYKRIK